MVRASFFLRYHSRPQCLRVCECALKLWETLRRRSQNLAIWASQRMLIDPNKTFCFFYIYFIAKVLCCFGIRTEEIQLTALKNFQVSKALVVAAEKTPLNVSNHRLETWSLHMLDSWLNISVDYFTRRISWENRTTMNIQSHCTRITLGNDLVFLFCFVFVFFLPVVFFVGNLRQEAKVFIHTRPLRVNTITWKSKKNQ